MSAVLGFLGPLLSFVVLLFSEFFSAKAKAQAEDKKFQVDQAAFQGIVNAALTKQLSTMAQVSAGAGSAWDGADSAIPKKSPEDSDPIL